LKKGWALAPGIELGLTAIVVSVTSVVVGLWAVG
jgi:hypothetical protein